MIVLREPREKFLSAVTYWYGRAEGGRDATAASWLCSGLKHVRANQLEALSVDDIHCFARRLKTNADEAVGVLSRGTGSLADAIRSLRGDFEVVGTQDSLEHALARAALALGWPAAQISAYIPYSDTGRTHTILDPPPPPRAGRLTPAALAALDDITCAERELYGGAGARRSARL